MKRARTFVILSVLVFCAFLLRGDLCIAQTATTQPSQPSVKRIAQIRIEGRVGERPAQFELFGTTSETLWSYIERLEKARSSDAICAVELILDTPSLGYAQAIELADAIGRVRAAGKPVYVYASILLPPDYIVASAATEIAMPSSGMLVSNGLRAEVMMLKGVLDWLGIEFDVLKVGRFKSAGESLTSDVLSDDARLMYNNLLDDLYGDVLDRLSAGRKLKREEAALLIDRGLFDGDSAVKARLVDHAVFFEDFQKMLGARYGPGTRIVTDFGKKATKIAFEGNLFNMFSKLFAPPSPSSSAAKVAVLYATGPILPGKAEGFFLFTSEVTASEAIREVLKKIAADSTVKALVVRVDSPGGSATASDEIWNALMRMRSRMPVVVSMGNTAASGGYYLATASDLILADPVTVTGSIGVFGAKLSLKGLYDKIGIKKEVFSRGANSGIFSDYGRMTETEREVFEELLRSTYDRFVERVATGRRMGVEKVRAAAEGSVWSGRKALQLSLVDELGGLQVAVERAAGKGHLAAGAYEVVLYPKPKTLIDFFSEGLNLDMGQETLLAMTGLLANHGPAGVSADKRMPRAALGAVVSRSSAVASWLWLMELVGSDPILALPESLVEIR